MGELEIQEDHERVRESQREPAKVQAHSELTGARENGEPEKTRESQRKPGRARALQS